MQTKRTRVHDAHRVEKLFVLLLLSHGFSFASRSRQIETKLIRETAQSLDSDALGGTQSATCRAKNLPNGRRFSDRGRDQAKQGMTSCWRDIHRASRGVKSRWQNADWAIRATKNRSRIVNKANMGTKNPRRSVGPTHQGTKIGRSRAWSAPRSKMSRRREAPNSVSYQFLQCFIDFEPSNQQTY